VAIAHESLSSIPPSSTTFVLDELCTPPAVATLLGVSPPTVYSAIRRAAGGLTHLRTPGGQIRVRRRDVLAYCHRSGLPVPGSLLPPRPELVIIHPDPLQGQRLKVALEPRYAVQLHRDAVGGLLAIGRSHPPLVLVSRSVGEGTIDRLVEAVEEGSSVGYVAIVVLEPKASRAAWDGSAFTSSLSLPEQGGRAGVDLSAAVDKLLGTE
jgi:excisionase family DNA binding protein